MGMDTDALRWFQLVADGYTVTEVSEVFGVSQPGVSRALARLEQEVGTPLLRRSGRVLRMTHAGTASSDTSTTWSTTSTTAWQRSTSWSTPRGAS